MLRFLVKYLLLAIILTAVAMLTAQWKLDKDIAKFADLIAPIADFEYESAKINLNGEVRINAIRAYIPSTKMTVEIGEIRFKAGNLYEMATLESRFRDHILPESGHLHLTDVLIPFDRQLIKAAKSSDAPSSSDLLISAFCGETDRFGLVQLDSMGYNYISFSSKHFYMLDQYSGSAVINGQIAVEEMADIAYQFNIGRVLTWLESIEERPIGQFQAEPVKPELALLEIRVADKGLNQNKAAYCATKESVEVDAYYEQHVAAIEERLQQAGITLADDLKQAYTQLIQPESEFSVFFQPQANFDVDGLNYYDFEELKTLSGFRLTVNQSQVAEFFNDWTSEKYRQIAAAELQQRIQEQGATQPLYQQVVVNKQFESVNLVEIDQYQSEKVRVTRDDGRVFEGQLQKTTAKSIWLYQNLPAGEVTIPFARTRIVKFEVYR